MHCHCVTALYASHIPPHHGRVDGQGTVKVYSHRQSAFVKSFSLADDEWPRTVVTTCGSCMSFRSSINHCIDYILCWMFVLIQNMLPTSNPGALLQAFYGCHNFMVHAFAHQFCHMMPPAHGMYGNSTGPLSGTLPSRQCCRLTRAPKKELSCVRLGS